MRADTPCIVYKGRHADTVWSTISTRCLSVLTAVITLIRRLRLSPRMLCKESKPGQRVLQIAAIGISCDWRFDFRWYWSSTYHPLMDFIISSSLILERGKLFLSWDFPMQLASSLLSNYTGWSCCRAWSYLIAIRPIGRRTYFPSRNDILQMMIAMGRTTSWPSQCRLDVSAVQQNPCSASSIQITLWWDLSVELVTCITDKKAQKCVQPGCLCRMTTDRLIVGNSSLHAYADRLMYHVQCIQYVVPFSWSLNLRDFAWNSSSY